MTILYIQRQRENTWLSYIYILYRIIETLSPLLKDKLMLSGEEASWRILKEALPTLEELKAKSSILFPAVEAAIVS